MSWKAWQRKESYKTLLKNAKCKHTLPTDILQITKIHRTVATETGCSRMITNTGSKTCFASGKVYTAQSMKPIT